MAATFKWVQTTGDSGSPTNTDITYINFGNVDQANITPVVDNPIVAGENSFEVWIRAHWTTYTTISNVKFWKSAGAYKTSEAIKAAVNSAYATPVASASSVATVDVPITEGACLVPNSPGASPEHSGYITMQLQTAADTPSGAVNQKTFTLKYDEV